MSNSGTEGAEKVIHEVLYILPALNIEVIGVETVMIWL